MTIKSNPGKTPFLAALLNLFCCGGVGYLYIGQTMKGITAIVLYVLFCIFVGFIFAGSLVLLAVGMSLEAVGWLFLVVSILFLVCLVGICCMIPSLCLMLIAFPLICPFMLLWMSPCMRFNYHQFHFEISINIREFLKHSGGVLVFVVPLVLLQGVFAIDVHTVCTKLQKEDIEENECTIILLGMLPGFKVSK